MALGTATVVGRWNHDGRPVIMDTIQFAGDGAYAAGGTANFRAYVQQAVGRGSLDIVAVYSLDGTHKLYYDRAADKLKIYSSANTEATGDLSGTTYKVLVLST